MPIIKSSDKRIKKLLRRLAGFEHICSGNLRSRSLVCGKKRCRCKGDPPALHGPYYYWSRRSKGRLVQKVLSPGQAELSFMESGLASLSANLKKNAGGLATVTVSLSVSELPQVFVTV